MKKKNKTGIMQKIREKRGAAMLECALMIPFWMLVMFGIMDFCTLANAKQDTMMISRSTVRYGSLKKTSESFGDNLRDMSQVQITMVNSVLNNEMETVRPGEDYLYAYPGNADGDAVYANTCVDVHLHLLQVWGTSKKKVCTDYMLMRTFEG